MISLHLSRAPLENLSLAQLRLGKIIETIMILTECLFWALIRDLNPPSPIFQLEVKGVHCLEGVLTGSKGKWTVIIVFYCPLTSSHSLVAVVVVVQSLSCAWLFVTPWTAACQASLPFTILPAFAQTLVHWVDDAINHLILCHLLLPLPSIFPSIRVFSNESALHIR